MKRMAGKALQWLIKDIGKGEMAARLSMDALRWCYGSCIYSW